jgi:hypothetical protein
MLTITIASAHIVVSRARLGTAPLVRLLQQPRAVGPLIPLPWIGLEETAQANITPSELRA